MRQRPPKRLVSAAPLLVTAGDRPKTVIPGFTGTSDDGIGWPHGRKPKGFLRDRRVRSRESPQNGQAALTATPPHLKGQKIAYYMRRLGFEMTERRYFD